MSGVADRTIVRLFFASTRVLDRSIRLLRGVFDGVWLGLLDLDRIALIDEEYYRHERMYLTDEYNRQGLWPWERKLIDTFFAGVSRIAVTSAGAGREVLALLDLGYDAVGFECNEKLAEFGNDLTVASGHGLRIHSAERDVWPKLADGFDAAVIGWGSYMHIAGRQRRVTLLEEARAALPDRAPVLLSFLPRSGDSIRFRTAVRIGNVFRRLLRREALELGDALSPLYGHYFTGDEIGTELSDAGFELVHCSMENYGQAVGLARVR